MSVSPALTHLPSIPLYTFYTGCYGDLDPSILKVGLSVLLSVARRSHIDYNGGTLKCLDYFCTSFWVQILEIKQELLIGRVSETNELYQLGSIIYFTPHDVNRIKGDLQWSIENLTVLVSERIIYHGDKVGYFYEHEMEPWSFNRIFYGWSEVYLPKEPIPLVEAKLLNLIDIDPIIAKFLDNVQMNGMFRLDSFNFKEYDELERNYSIFPLEYVQSQD
ncbi:hypothetical protein [Rufibacter roseus]|uniref:Uncharacterized protein n=1 Tax=Rufibacter roseus TaxID=1567108 RepID=A0ABW2DM47_9BACT|nr:hypothetical protein [Rufibacter roseus]